MNKKEKMIKSAVAAFLVLSTTAAFAEKAATPPTEKCYGVVRAGMNDCQTATDECAGSAKKDRQGDAFIFLPKDLCQKLAGSSLTPIK